MDVFPRARSPTRLLLLLGAGDQVNSLSLCPSKAARLPGALFRFRFLGFALGRQLSAPLGSLGPQRMHSFLVFSIRRARPRVPAHVRGQQRGQIRSAGRRSLGLAGPRTKGPLCTPPLRAPVPVGLNKHAAATRTLPPAFVRARNSDPIYRPRALMMGALLRGAWRQSPTSRQWSKFKMEQLRQHNSTEHANGFWWVVIPVDDGSL